jgi:hypothetical protein
MTTITIIGLAAIAIFSIFKWAYWRYQYFELKKDVLGDFKDTEITLTMEGADLFGMKEFMEKGK